jgi:hypothetical protein
MGSVSLAMQALRSEDEPVVQKVLGDRVRAAIARGMADGTAQRYMMQRGGRGGGGR